MNDYPLAASLSRGLTEHSLARPSYAALVFSRACLTGVYSNDVQGGSFEITTKH